jgi:hypothetical protein
MAPRPSPDPLRPFHEIGPTLPGTEATPPVARGRAARHTGPDAGALPDDAWTRPPVAIGSDIVAAVARIDADALDAMLRRYDFLLGPPPRPLRDREAWFDPVQQARWVAKGSARRYRWLVPFIGEREAMRPEWEAAHRDSPLAAGVMMEVYRQELDYGSDRHVRRIALRSLWRLAVMDSVRSIPRAGPLEQLAGPELLAHLSILDLGAADWDYRTLGTALLPALAPGDVERLHAYWGPPGRHADFVSAYPQLVRDALHRHALADLARSNAAKARIGLDEIPMERWLEEKVLSLLA